VVQERRHRTNRLLIDTGPVVDDTHAITVAFARPEAQVEAITTVAGNVSLERTTANACIVLDALERDVAVYAGRDRALVAKDQRDWFDMMGQGPNVDLVLEVDVGRVRELMQAAVRCRPGKESAHVSAAMSVLSLM
jgi:inosine-uridine nucleoside N-ribohydrolase